MTEKHYHIELFNGDLTKVVFEDGYSPYGVTGRSAHQAMRELQEFRASRQQHDLSVLRHRYYARPNGPETEVEVVDEVKPPKRNKRKVE